VHRKFSARAKRMRTSRFTGSILPACAVAAALTCVLIGAPASAAGVGSRAGTIAFLRTVGDGPDSLFAIRADGSGLRRLTPSSADVGAYEWAPDGARIAYLDRRGALWLVRPDGTGRERLAARSPLRDSWELSWSPDGKAIAVLARASGTPPTNSSSEFGIQIIPTDAGAPRRLPSGDAISLDWSPRGDQISYTDGSGQQRVIRTDGSKARLFFRRRLNHGGAMPTWSPDGTHVGFAGCRFRHGRCVDRYAGIYVADSDGSDFHLVTGHAYNEYGFAWSPDGRSILYGRADREGIYVISPDGRNNHRLTRDSPRPADFGALTWAPDGRSIAYATDRTGNGDIYVIDTHGHNKLRLTNTAASDIDPSWQPQ
jgi:TolB protein